MHWLAFALVLSLGAVRFWIGNHLELFGDEAFYWLESRHPAIGYSEVPLLVPLMVGVGTALLGDTYLGVRLLFQIMSLLTPLAVWWLARAVTHERHALYSLILATALPLMSGIGILALPDTPLLLFGILSLGAAARALQQDRARDWIVLGLCLALGLLSHYRFVLIPAALLMASLSGADTRRLWRGPGPWLAVLIAAEGLLPTLAFNVMNGFPALGFHFAERHPWTFQAEGLKYPLVQALTTSPLLFLALMAAFVPLWQDCRAGKPAARLLLISAVLGLGSYGLLAPWSDQRSTNIHWPLSGYVPLLVYVPILLERLRPRMGQLATHCLTVLVPVSGGLMVMAGIGWFIGIVHLDKLPYPRNELVTANMAGWSAIADRVRTQEHALIVTDNYYLAAQLAFELKRSDGILTLDDDKAFRDGRAWQLQHWGWRLPAHDPADWPDQALAVLESSRHSETDLLQMQRTLCERWPGLHSLADLDQFHGMRRVAVLRLDTQAARNHPDRFCQPLRGWVEQPDLKQTRAEGMIDMRGWFSHETGVETLWLEVDGKTVAQAEYGLHRDDVAATLPGWNDPQLPYIGFHLFWDSHQHPDGWHRLQLKLRTQTGHDYLAWNRWVQIRNTP